MATAPTFYALLHLTILIQATCASSGLASGVSKFVPACAEQCVLSFIDISFGGEACGPDFSLQCLCSTRGKSGFTLGEAAVQCITAESQFGSCSSSDANQRVRDAAYFMCRDQRGAIDPTHTLITASLLLPTASGDFVSFPPVEPTSADPDLPLPTSLPTTLVTETRPPPPRPTITRSSARPQPTASEETSARSTEEPTSSETASREPTIGSDTATPLPPAETGADGDDADDEGDDEGDDEDAGSPALNTGQIAGISVGVVAAAAIALGAVFLARYCRRKRHPGVKTGFLPRRSTWGYLVNNGDTEPSRDGGETAQRNTLWPPVGPTNPIHDQPVQTIPPPAYTRQSTHPRASVGPEAIGLALSPPFKRDPAPQSPNSRRLSKLLPAKPVMPPLFARLTSSPQEASDLALRNEGPPQLPPLTGFMTRQSPPRNQEIRRVPSSRSGETQQYPPRLDSIQRNPPHNEDTRGSPPRTEDKQLPPVPLTLQIPQTGTVTAIDGISRARESTMTEFEEDSCLSPEGQIWRPPSSAPLSEAPTYVADKNGNWILADAASSISPEPKTAPPTGTMMPIYPPPASVSRSSLSQGRAAERPSLAPAPQIARSQTAASSVYSQLSPTPRPLFYNDLNDQRQSSSASRTSRPPMDRASSRSSDITLFESSSDESKEPTPPEIRRTLTPVVESPRQETGRSPVVYPHIQGRVRNSRQTGPPPRRPPVYYPPGQPSPTLGMMQQQPQQGQGMASYNVPTRGRRPAESPSDVRSGSPPTMPTVPTMRLVEPSPEPDDRVRLPSTHRPPSFNRPPSQMQQPPHSRRPPMPHNSQYRQQRLRPQGGPFPRMPPGSGAPLQPLNQENHQAPKRSSSGDYEPFTLGQSRAAPPKNYQAYTPGNSAPYPSPQRPNFRPAPSPQHPNFRPAPQQQPPRLYTNMPSRPPVLNTFASPVSEASSSSSLLAKRLGSDRAAQMAIPTEQAQQGPSRGQKWNRGEPRTPDQGNDLPRTPGWMPRLTPTRRGDDLFLNVQ